MNKAILSFGTLLLLTFSLNATTWFPSKHTCPVCNHTDTYQQWGSYGSYIYNWPSKYQYVYWPLTDDQSIYCCPNCYFSAYLWDFDSIAPDRIDTIARFLKTVIIDKNYKDYLDIPATTRLEIAENIYKILGQNDMFWCQFYRVLGYYLEDEDNTVKARESRLKALEIARTMLSDTAYIGQNKELLFIIAAMHNFTGDKDSALFYLEKASKLTYQNTKWKEENAKGLDNYLSELTTDYIALLRKEDEE